MMSRRRFSKSLTTGRSTLQYVRFRAYLSVNRFMPHPPAASPDAERDETSSTRFRHLNRDDLLLVRSYEPDFMAEVDRAILAGRPVYLQLFGYETNKDIIAACLWYALDHGVQVVVSAESNKIEES